LNKFKGSKGHWLTKKLFLETCQGDLDRVLYTIREDDKTYRGITYPSIQKIFVELEDPTEYFIAKEYFGSWKHWVILSEGILSTEIESWRDELEVRLRAKGLEQIIKLSGDGDRNAAKILLDKGWSKRKAGAPSKQDKVNELKKQASIVSIVDNDLARLGIGDK
tara:strand:+ start:349 stop:840 length:492 start_codon:yes stop_codon:yes gene_type:complete